MQPTPVKSLPSASASPIFVLNGPNLNLLGLREPEVYGVDTLADIESACRDHAAGFGLEIVFRQSNHEGELVSWIQEARASADGLIINGAAYSHTSIAIHDALLMLDIPVVEVHLTNVFKREPFRHHSRISGTAQGVICGFGLNSYVLALTAIAQIIGRE